MLPSNWECSECFFFFKILAAGGVSYFNRTKELSYWLKISLIKLKSSLIELKSSLIDLTISLIQLKSFLIESACTSMCRHIYDRNIVNCDFKQPIQQQQQQQRIQGFSYWIKDKKLSNWIKDDMKSYIPLETATIFFLANLFSKTGYWLGVCHGWFHLHELTRAARSENRELQNEKVLPIPGLELRTPDSQV